MVRSGVGAERGVAAPPLHAAAIVSRIGATARAGYGMRAIDTCDRNRRRLLRVHSEELQDPTTILLT
jgi:hypothetical protein